MLRQKSGAMAIEIQYRFKLTYSQTIEYLMEAKNDFSLLKNGTKPKLQMKITQIPKRPGKQLSKKIDKIS